MNRKVVSMSVTRTFAPLAIVLFLFGVLLAPLATPLAHAATSSDRVAVAIDVFDGKTDTVLASATVYGGVYSPDTSSTIEDKNITDANGRAVLLLPLGNGSLTVARDGYSTVNEPLSVTGPMKMRVDLKPLPPRDAIVTGTVTDSVTGAPVQGASVTISPGYYYMGAGSSPPPPTSPPSGSANATDASSGSNGSSSTAVAAMPFRCCDDSNAYKSTTTDAGGHFTLATTPGTRILNAYHDGFVGFSTSVQLESGTTTRDITLRAFPKADARFDGKVIDRVTGLPVAGAQVSVTNFEWGRGNYTTTDATGTFTMTLMPGYTELWVYAYAPQNSGVTAAGSGGAETAIAPAHSYYEWVSDQTLTSGANAITVSLKPKADPTVVLLGYVIDAKNHTGIAGASVSVRNDDTNEWGSATTDADGSYKLLVQPGYLVLSAYATHHFSGNLVVEAGGPGPLRTDVALTPGDPGYGYGGCGGGYVCPLASKGDAVATSPGAATGAPPPQTDSSGASAPPAGTNAASAPPTGGTSAGSHATYTGTAGGLGPYTAPPTGGTTGPTIESPKTAVPSIDLVATLGVLAALALARARNRSR
ncbi:MAG: carboxypeptidase-like regulatory domain-containing protein [Thermoplasmatota archaeon]